MKKIAMVCQRYGLEINGGAELHSRQVAERLSRYYEVDIFTTCAKDYVTWKNEYPQGTELLNGVRVHRFETERERNTQSFNQQSQKVFFGRPHSAADEEIWLEEQGPVCGALIQFISAHYRDFQAVIFMTYLYYLTAWGILSGIENALLIPTAHDEPPIYLKHYYKVFNAPKGIIYNTAEEKKFVEKIMKNEQIASVVAGVGIEIPAEVTLESAGERFGLGSYIVYTGRIDESKGCKSLFSFFIEYKKRNPGDLKLVLMGKTVMDIPRHPDIIYLGFVSDEEKFTVMKDARLLVLFSEFESLSMVVLESMALGRPVLVNGKCEVLKGHCVKSNAGLYFKGYFEFEGALNFLIANPQEYLAMQENARRYVADYYRWDVIIEKIRGLIEAL